MKTENVQKLLLIGKIILSIITFYALHVLAENFPLGEVSTGLVFWVLGGSNILIGLAFLVLFVKIIDREKTITAAWFSPQRHVKEFFIGGLLGSICIMLGFLIIINFNWSQVEIGYLRINYLLGTLFLFLCVGFLEELFFRGYVLRKLLEKFSPLVSLLFSSLAFSLIHFISQKIAILPMINIFFIGLLLGILFIKAKNIWIVTGFHFLWNYVQAILGFNVSGGEYPSILYLNFEHMNLFNGGEFGFEGSCVCTIIVLLTICFYYKKLDRGLLSTNR